MLLRYVPYSVLMFVLNEIFLFFQDYKIRSLIRKCRTITVRQFMTIHLWTMTRCEQI